MKARWLLGLLCVASVTAAQAEVVFLATFDNDSVSDSAGGLDGTVTGTAAYGAGKHGKALQLDGASAVTYQKSAALGGLKEPITVGAWVNPSALASWTNIVEMDGPAGSWKLGFSDAKPVWTTYRVKDHEGVGPVPLNEWTHIAATYDAVTATIYLNGKVDSEIAGSGSINVADAAVPTLDIGWRSTTKSAFLSAALDEVFVANTLMSAAEIASAMNGLGGTTAVEARGKLATRWATLKSVR